MGLSRKSRNKHGGSITQGRGGMRISRKERDRDTESGNKNSLKKRKDMRSFEKGEGKKKS